MFFFNITILIKVHLGLKNMIKQSNIFQVFYKFKINQLFCQQYIRSSI